MRPIVFTTLVNMEVLRGRSKTGCKGMLLDMFGTFVGRWRSSSAIKSNHRIGRFTRREQEQGIQRPHRGDQLQPGARRRPAATATWQSADVILVGVSRSGKTPTSLYLAMQHGLKAANYPLIPEDFERGQLPPALVPHRKQDASA